MSNYRTVFSLSLSKFLYRPARRVFNLCAAWLGTFKRHDTETEFLPAALEILETPASPVKRAIAVSISLFLVMALAWSYFGSIDIVVTSTGKIIPVGRTKIIQPLESGVVRAIHVQDGQQVKANDVLIEIDTTINEAEQARLQSELTATELESARLRAALKMSLDPVLDFVAPAGAPQAQIDLQLSQLTSQVTEIRSKLTGIDNQIAQGKGNQAAVEAMIGKLNKSMPLLKERARMSTQLSEKGYGSKFDALTIQQELIEYEQELQVQQGRLSEAASGVASLQEQRLQAEAEFRQRSLDLLSQAEQNATALRTQLVQVNKKYNLQTLTAPIDGTIQQLAIHTEGGVVSPAQALLAIVPKDSKLEVDAMISNRDVGFVFEGQEVKVKIDTFNFTKYGLITGKIISISQDAIVQQKPVISTEGRKKSGAENESSEPIGQELVYAARIHLDKAEIQIDDRLVSLFPGMAVTVEIKTGRRRVIEYLLSPLSKHKSEVLHER